MRSTFILSLMTCSIMLGGCASSVPEIPLTPTPSAYEDRMLDSLGSQRFSEQQMLYMRKIQSLEHELDALDRRRKDLEASTGVSELEATAGHLKASDSEAVRMNDFASATQDSQARIAKESAGQAVTQSMIENERDRKLMEADLAANKRLFELDQVYARSIQSAQSDAEQTRLTRELDLEKARSEAKRKKARIEADNASQLLKLEQSYEGRIQESRRIAQASDIAAESHNQSQRIRIALANADAKRRTAGDVAKAKVIIDDLITEKRQAVSPIEDEVAKLNDQIAGLRGTLASVTASFDSKIARENTQLASLQAEAQRLAEVEQGLINAPANTAVALNDPTTVSLEKELLQAKRSLEVAKVASLAAIDEELSGSLNIASASYAIAGNVSHDAPMALLKKSAEESSIRADLAVQRTEINNQARSQLAELTVKTEIAKANVIAPVMTSRAVYSGSYGEQPRAFAVRERSEARELVAKAKAVAEIKPVAIAKAVPAPTPIQTPGSNDGVAPLRVASPVEARRVGAVLAIVDDVVIAKGVVAGGDVKPLVVAPAATTYSVVYRYAEKGSAQKFMSYLKAYGVQDFTYRYSEKLQQHILWMGKYTTKQQAVNRVSFLNQTTKTSNATIVEQDL